MENSLSAMAEKYRKTFGLTEEDLAIARKACKAVKNERANLYTEFYTWFGSQEVLRSAFTEEVLADGGKSEDDQWEDLILAKIDERYLERQRGMGAMFHSVNVPYEVCLEVIVTYYEVWEKILLRHGITDYRVLGVFKRIAHIACSVIVDTYNEMTTEKMRSQNAVLMEMSTPVTQLWNGILLLPLVGIIDSKRAQETMTSMLNKIGQCQSKAFILDISGVAVMDTAVANYIIKITKATKLMGCNCIISGISGAVAQTIVELGIQIDEINTTGNMQDALNTALQLTGSQITAIGIAAA